MRFYTNVQMVGDHFLVRGYEDGKHFATREKFYPTLFVESKRKSKYKTLDGLPVEPVEPGTVRDCREFIKKYNEVENFNIYGNERYIYQYISEKYPEVEVNFDTEKIKLTTIDIEVASENGFPDVESCAEEVLLITLQDYATKQIRTWGRGSFNNKQDNVIYKGFNTEYELLTDFIHWWMIEDNTPEVITGWNSKLYDIPYLCRRIDRILGEKLKKRMSPWGLVTEEETYISGRKHLSMISEEYHSYIILTCIKSLLTRHKSHIVWIILRVLNLGRKNLTTQSLIHLRISTQKVGKSLLNIISLTLNLLTVWKTR